jgi:microsomal dipeptidase-like Zn-dependent dipeptidase
MDTSAGAIVVATLLGPVFAVQVQKYLERHRDQKRVKDTIFRTLMTTRANRLAPDHVQALNGIEIAFYGGGEKEKRVREGWRAYHDYLNDRSYQPDRMQEWMVKQIDLFIELLHDMAVCLGYDFDKTHIKSSWYAPEAHGTVEEELNAIRSSLAEIVTGKRPFPIGIHPTSEEEAKKTAELRELLVEWLTRQNQTSLAVEGTGKASGGSPQ